VPLTYWNESLGLAVIIDAAAMSIIHSHRQLEADANESGGVLIGERRGVHVWVRTATPPQRSDLRTRTSFLRRSKKHQEMVNDAWRLSDGAQVYVGEWHTHPEHMPRPSLVDRAGLLVRAMQARQSLVVLIAGISEDFVGVQSSLLLTHCVLQKNSV